MNRQPEPRHVGRRQISWNHIVAACRDLTDRMSGEKYEIILAVSRGGIVPAAILSHLLGVPNIGLIHVDEEDNKTAIRMPKIGGFNSILIIDDIVDTGKTFRALMDFCGETNAIDYAALFLKESSGLMAQITFSILAEQEPWHVFPWEVE